MPRVRCRAGCYVLTAPDGNGANVTLQVGPEGVLLVDTQTADNAPRVFGAVRALSPEPIRWIVNTSARLDHMGANDALARLGTTPASLGRPRIVAHETSSVVSSAWRRSRAMPGRTTTSSRATKTSSSTAKR